MKTLEEIEREYFDEGGAVYANWKQEVCQRYADQFALAFLRAKFKDYNSITTNAESHDNAYDLLNDFKKTLK